MPLLASLNCVHRTVVFSLQPRSHSEPVLSELEGPQLASPCSRSARSCRSADSFASSLSSSALSCSGAFTEEGGWQVAWTPLLPSEIKVRMASARLHLLQLRSGLFPLVHHPLHPFLVALGGIGLVCVLVLRRMYSTRNEASNSLLKNRSTCFPMMRQLWQRIRNTP